MLLIGKGKPMHIIPRQIVPTNAERYMIPQFLSDTQDDFQTNLAYSDIDKIIDNTKGLQSFEFDGETMWIPSLQAPSGRIGINVQEFKDYLTRVGFYKNIKEI